MKIVQGEFDWTSPLIPLDSKKVKYIVIHHTDHPTATADMIHKWHKANKWNGIGYSEFICKDGTAVICRGENIGAHTHGYNSKSYGIALQADMDKEDKLPNEQAYCLYMRIIDAMKRYNLGIESIKFHKDLTSTDCPGKNLNKEKIIKGVKYYLKGA